MRYRRCPCSVPPSTVPMLRAAWRRPVSTNVPRRFVVVTECFGMVNFRTGAGRFPALRSMPGMRLRLPTPRAGRPVVVRGGDSLALRLVEELVGMEEPVTVVVDDPDTSHARRMAKLGARVVTGPSGEVRTLRAAGVASARALALVADDDVGNIQAALAAQELNPRLRLVVRMFN